MSERNLPSEEKPKPCKHDPFKYNTLIVEAHPLAGVRIRCKICGYLASVGKRGAVVPFAGIVEYVV